MSEKELSAEEIKRNTLPLLRHAETIYVLMSVCTKMPYVVCDPETYDDEVIVFVNEQAAKQEAVRLLQQGEPVQVVSVKNESLLAFYISLLPIGANCLRVNKGCLLYTSIHPVVRGFIIRNTKGSVGIQTVITIVWITQFKTTTVSGLSLIHI